jgi:hypothetical protein
MNPRMLLIVLLFQLCTASLVVGQAPPATEAPIDFRKARVLSEKRRSGAELTEGEQAYLDRALRVRQERMRRIREAQRKPPATLVPLTDMSTQDRYEAEDGGLYGQGRNHPTEDLHTAAEKAIASITPRDDEGSPSPDGKIGFVSISMSNATMEFSTFKRLADESPQKSPQVVIVDCAQGGQAMAQWAPADARPWQVAQQRLEAAGVSAMQVQTAWVKLANMAPVGTLQEHGQQLAEDTIKVLVNAKERFPNLRIAYLGSRIWAGNATGALNPEPYAYESAFVVRWLIQRQLRGDEELSTERVPLLLWGPYLWAEGEKGRRMDDLVWVRDDFTDDGVHPSPSGRQKVARLLLDFVHNGPLAKPWFTLH